MNRKLALETFMLMSLLVILAAPAGASSQTTVYVAPSMITVRVGQTFLVSINISDVIDLYGWEFKLKWNPTVLNALNVTEGDFLKSGGETYLVSELNNTEGYMHVACTLIGYITGVNGSGTLSTVEFKVEEDGESILDLYDTTLVNSLEQPIVHTTVDSNFMTIVRDVTIVNVTSSKTVVVAGEIVYITVVVNNIGTETETFDVTAYYNNTAIQTQTISNLIPNAQTSLTFNWDTTDVMPSNYTIKAQASVVPDETDTANNIHTDGTVRVLSPPSAIFTYETIDLVDNITVMTFNASASHDPDGFIVSYAWDFGDDTPVVIETDPIVTHNFSAGTYDVTLTVIDNEGLIDSTTIALDIVTIVGDVNNDGIVDIFDVVLVAKAFGSNSKEQNWNSDADLNKDGVIDIYDVVIVAIHFGEHV